MNYMSIYKTSLADGLGWRSVLFVSGCGHKCVGCQNKKSWNPTSGKKFTEKTKEKLFETIHDNIDGLTISGGDPLYKTNIDEVTKLCKEFKEVFPDKTIWLYTGYLYENVKDLEIMAYIDVIVDGKFKIDKRDTTLAFRGSSNQRIIDVHTGEELDL